MSGVPGADPAKDLAARALALIAKCNDAAALQQMADNARLQGEAEVEKAALLRLYHVRPAAKPGTLEHDVWQSIFALEGALKSERGKTILLSRTRQKISRDGERKTVADLVIGKPSDGFQMLIDRGMPKLTFEAMAIRHPNIFGTAVVDAASARLEEAGVKTADLKK